MQKFKFKQTEIGMIPEDWEVKTLGEVVTFQRGYDLPIAKFKEGNIPVLKSNGLAGYHSEFKAKGPGVLLGRSGKIGKPMFIEDNYWPHNTTLFSREFHHSNPKFVYYLIKTLKLENYNAGSAVPTLNRNHIHPIMVAIPKHLSEQKAIAKILSDLDSKIEFLRQQNKILEKIGHMLFKYWFIEKRNEKWEKKNIKEFLEFEKGIEPGSKAYEIKKSNENIKFIRVGDISTPDRDPKYISTDLATDKLCNERDILLSLDATIGVVRIGMKGSFSGGVRKVYAKNKIIPKGYIYFLLKSKYVQETIKTYANGTTILHAGDSLNHMFLHLPNRKTFSRFESLVDPIFEKLVVNLKNIKELSKIRDLLLPKLMSGEIRIK